MRRWIVTLAAMLFVAGPIEAKVQEGPIIFADGALKASMKGLENLWVEKGRPRLQIVFGDSEDLARDIANGASADLFFSADDSIIDRLEAQNLTVKGERAPIYRNRNRLVLVGKAHSSATSREAVDLTKPSAVSFIESGKLSGSIAIADPKTAAGRYTMNALSVMGVWPLVEDRVALGKDAQEALAMVARGEVQWGIVYKSDYNRTPDGKKVAMVSEFPQEFRDTIRHSVVRMNASRHPEAKAFYDFMLSSAGKMALSNGP